MANAKKISIDAKNADLFGILNSVFDDQPLTYTVMGKVIIVKEKPVKKETLAVAIARDIRGRVVNEDGQGIEGVSVMVKGTNNATSTNSNGEFELPNVDEQATIIFSGVNIESREIKLSGRTNLGTITFKTKVTAMEKIEITVNTGYQTLSKERSAGSFSKPDMDIVANRTTSMNVLQSLDGLVPGMVVNNAPSKSQFLIRGLATTGAPALNGNGSYSGTSTQPLYVVDGLVIPDMSSINPQDVKDITVLKDATAASIWGARAANGVIVITTKRGAFNSKLRVNYDGFMNFQGKPELNYFPQLNSQQFVATGVELFNTPGYQAQYPWATVNTVTGGGIAPHELILYNQLRGLITADQATHSLDSLANISNRGQIKDLFYRNAMLSNQTISLSGGSDKYSFYGSTSFTNNTSNQPGEKNETYKINLRQDIKANKFLRFYIITDLSNNNSASKRNLNVDYSFYPYQQFRDDNGKNMSIPFMTGQPNEILADMEARSRFSLKYNPLDEFNYGNTKNNSLLARINTGATVNILKNLRFEGNYGYIKGSSAGREFESLQSYTVRKEIVNFTVAPNATTPPQYYLPTNGGRLTSSSSEQRNWTVRNQLIFEQSWKKHEFTVLAGQEAQEQFSTNQRNRVRGFDETLLTTAPIDYKALGGLLQNTVYPNYGTYGSILTYDAFSTNETTTRFTSYYSNLSYTFDRKYAFNGSWRMDQSNLFGKDKAAQNKPVYSLGGKWNISNETFMQTVKGVQQLALRLTYGVTGNSPNVGVASSYDITTPSGSAFFPNSVGLRIATPGNDNLSWESTKTLNLGIDFSVLNSRISGTVDIYQKKTDNLLGLVYPNSLTGWPAIVGNQGNITNKGIEISLQSLNVRSKDFSWTSSFVFAYNKNNIDKLTFGVPITTGAQRVASILAEGYPAFTVFAYRYEGLDNTGAPLVGLKDGSKTSAKLIAKPDDIVYAGTYQPVWNGGFSNNFRYKNFRLSANMIYNMGHVMRRQRNLMFGGQLHRNMSVDFLDRWKAPGDELYTDIPAYLTNGSPNAGLINTDYFTYGDNNVVDASFIKLRDVTLFFDLPRNLINKVNMQGVTFRAQISNIMVWKANKFDIDPEFQGLAIPTNQHSVSLGVNVSL